MLDFFVYLLTIMVLHLLMMILLVLDEMIKFIGVSLLINMEGKLALHVIQSPVDLHELG